MQSIRIKKVSITKVNTDIIVNAANSALHQGGGVCGYIFQAAGAKELQKACNTLGSCPTGSAVITPGFALSKYIVHAVGPVWQGGNNREPQKLYSCYQKSMDLAREVQVSSIGFPLISSGIFGYPVDKAWRKAIQAIRDWYIAHPGEDIEVVFAVLDEEILKTGKQILSEEAPRFQIAERSDWKTEDMPEKSEVFSLQRYFTQKQLNALRRGGIPGTMEDKWFWYVEEDRLYAHRSWTGYCIYIVEFHKDSQHLVRVNRDPGQYSCTDIEEDARILNNLFDWWQEGA